MSESGEVVHKCPDCGSELILKQGRRGPFYSCPNWSKNKSKGKCESTVDGAPSDAEPGIANEVASANLYPLDGTDYEYRRDTSKWEPLGSWHEQFENEFNK